MLATIRDIITLAANDLRTGEAEILADNVARLERECISKIADQTREEVLKHLWLQLAEQGVHLGNVELSLLATSKLKINQLGVLAKSITQGASPFDKRLLALYYIANYFQLESSLDPKIVGVQINTSSSNTIFEHEPSLKFHLDRHDWPAALELIGDKIQSVRHRELVKSLVFYEQAKYYEIDENFNEALLNHEKSATQRSHSPRVIIKHLMSSAQHVLEEYCLTTISLFSFWPKYLVACKRFEAAGEIFKSRKDMLSYTRCAILNGSLKQEEARVLGTLPDKMQEFISDTSTTKWFNKKMVDFIISTSMDLDSTTRALLAELASQNLRHNNISKACSISLCLNQPSRFLNQSTALLNQSKTLQLTTYFGSCHILAINLIDFLIEQYSRQVRGKLAENEPQTLFLACLKLGLLDEALQVFSQDTQRDEKSMELAIEHIEGLIATRHSGSLDNVNPELKGSTISLIHKSLTSENDKDLTTHVITVVILSLTMFLFKLEAKDHSLDDSIQKLETMFESLGEYFDELSFNASGALVRAANGLVVAVKGKLDALVDSETIRSGFRQLIETTAGRCMIESNYKSAAMLYSQIEDNVNAVKSLMRTGEVDTVINFALLVRDITVNRITINYLKHLRTDPAVVKGFIARSKL